MPCRRAERGGGQRGEEAGLGDRAGAGAVTRGDGDGLALRAARRARRALEPGPGAASAGGHPQRRRAARRRDRRLGHAAGDRRPAPVRRPARSAVGAPGRGARGGAACLGLGLGSLRAARDGRPGAAARPGHRPAQCRRDPALGRSVRGTGGDRAAPSRGAGDRGAGQGSLGRARAPALPAGAEPRRRDGEPARDGLRDRRARRGGGGADRRGAARLPGPAAGARARRRGAGHARTDRRLCDRLARIPAAGGFGSLNVSNAAAVALYAASQAGGM